MKTFFKLLFTFSLVLCLCSCGGNSSKKETASKAEVKQTEKAQENASLSGKEEKESGDKKSSSEKKEEDTVSEHTVSFFSAAPDEFYFTSGAGGWSTVIQVNDDGTFTGEFHDSNMGETGAKNPNGSVSRCLFSGTFSTPFPLDEYTYISTLENMDIKTPVGEVTYKDGVKYENTTPYGLEKAKEVVFYLPGTPVSVLPEGFLSWYRMNYEVGDKLPDNIYGIYSFNDETAFIGKTK